VTLPRNPLVPEGFNGVRHHMPYFNYFTMGPLVRRMGQSETSIENAA
jgi:hypothetical protein